MYAGEGNIEFQSKGSADFSGAHLVAKKNVHISSDEELKLTTLFERVFIPNGHRDVVSAQTRIEAIEGSVTALGKTGFKMRGASIRALFDIVAGSTHGDTEIEDILLQQLTTTTHQDGDEETTTTQQIESSHASEVISKHGSTKVICGEDHKTRITGSQIKALINIIFEGGEVETNARAAVSSTNTTSNTEETFSSKSTTNNQQSATLYPTLLEAQNIYTKTKKANYRGTDFIADVFVDDTEEGAYLGPTIARLEYLQQYISESPMAKSDVGTQGWYEVMQPCRLMVREVVRTIDKGVLKLESVIRDEDRTKFLCKFAETTYQLKQWQTSWNKTEKLIPDEALVVVALGIAAATQGMGGALFSSAVGGATGGTMVASTLGSAVSSAGFTAACTQFGTAVLGSGDPLKAAQSLVSEQGLRSIASSMAKAALIGNGGYNTTAGFGENLLINMARAGVGTCVDSTIGKQPVNGQTFLKAGLQACVETGAAYGIQSLGVLPRDTFGDQFLHKSGLAVNAAVAKSTSNLITGEKVEKDVIAASFGAVVGQLIAEGLTDEAAIKASIQEKAKEDGIVLTPEREKELYAKAIENISNISRLCAGTLSLAIGLDVSSTIVGATTVVENDYIPRTLDKLTTELIEQNLKDQGYAEKEVREVTHQVDEIAHEMAAADREMAQAEEKAVQKIKARQEIKKVVKNSSRNQEAINLLSEINHGEVDLISKTTMIEPSYEYQDIVLELAQEKQQIATKHQQALSSRSWHEGVRDAAVEAGEILKEAAIGAFNQALNDFSYIPNPIGSAAVAVTEARDVYTGTKTFGEASFDLGMGVFLGKVTQVTGKAVMKGAKAIIKPVIEKSKGALTTFTDYLSTKMGKGAKLQQTIHEIDYKFQSSFWNRSDVHTFRGQTNKVYKRDDLIDPLKIDEYTGLTNIELMKQGRAPISIDGSPLNLHHSTQMNNSSLIEITQSFHQQYGKVIHINPPSIPSGIDRDLFKKWRSDYWKERAKDF